MGYNELPMLLWFQMNSKGPQPYIYMCPFFHKLPSHPGCHTTLSRVPCACFCFYCNYSSFFAPSQRLRIQNIPEAKSLQNVIPISQWLSSPWDPGWSSLGGSTCPNSNFGLSIPMRLLKALGHCHLLYLHLLAIKWKMPSEEKLVENILFIPFCFPFLIFHHSIYLSLLLHLSQ